MSKFGKSEKFKGLPLWVNAIKLIPPFLISGIEKAFLSIKVSKKALISLIDQGVASATNFLTVVIIGRFCTKDQLGLYSLGFSIVVFTLAIQNSLISMPYTVYSPRLHRDNSFNFYNGSSFIHHLVLSILISFCLFLFGIYLSFNQNGMKGLDSIILTLSITISMFLFRQFFRRMLFAQLRMNIAFLLDLCVAVIQIGGLILLLYLNILSAINAYFVSGIASAFFTFLLFLTALRMFRFKFSNAISTIRLHWAFSRWLLGSALVMMTATQSYLWLLSYFHGTGNTGTFGACIGIVYLINPLLIGTANFLDPKAAHALAKGGLKEMHRVLLKSTFLIGISVGISSLILIIFGGWFVSFLYGNKYTGNGLIVAVLALSNLSFALSIPANSGLMAIEQTHAFIKSSLISLLITAFLGSWLVVYYGLIGAAFGLFLAMSSSSLFRWVVLTRTSCVRFNI